jgi:hypothetical protein
MSDRMDFEIVCPNDHDQTVTFSQEEFEEALKSGALVFHCNTATPTGLHPLKKLPNFESSSRRIPASAGREGTSDQLGGAATMRAVRDSLINLETSGPALATGMWHLLEASLNLYRLHFAGGLPLPRYHSFAPRPDGPTLKIPGTLHFLSLRLCLDWQSDSRGTAAVSCVAFLVLN